ncbi:MAG: polyketide synthase, partial [Acidobacteriota bacterium]
MSGQDIAIIGMSCVFPGARNLRAYWENILNGVDAVTDAPDEWEAERFFSATSESGDKTYCRRGGFLHGLAEFDPVRYGIMPGSVDGTEPDHFLALATASEALADARIGNLDKVREQTAVIIGRGTYVNRGNATALQHSVGLDSVIGVLKQLHPEYETGELDEIRRRLKESLPAFHADTAPGLVPNIISGRIANRLNLMGPNYIVDAACASSLIAVDLAVRELRSGRCDMAIAGGVHASTSPVIMIIFSQLNALSRKGAIRPFDAGADGTLLGEGAGVVVLKRLADAEREGDRVYAVVKGVGSSSDGRALGLLAPRVEGEALALRRAYGDAGVEPATVALLEAHGTATEAGDVAEVSALNLVFGKRRGDVPTVALGSVKSMIGHTMPASGMAGFIKAALSLHHKVLPPTLHCETPNPHLDLGNSCFYLNTAPRPWIHGFSGSPRRAGVNAFGFGGVNAHAVLEEYTGPHPAAGLQHTWENELFVLTAGSREALVREANQLDSRIAEGFGDSSLKDLAWSLSQRPFRPSRLAIVASSLQDLQSKLRRAATRLNDPQARRIRDPEGIYFFAEPLATRGGTAFLYPGEGAQYPNMLADLCMHF